MRSIQVGREDIQAAHTFGPIKVWILACNGNTGRGSTRREVAICPLDLKE